MDAKDKTKVKLAELGKTHKVKNLKRVHPFLRKDYRAITKAETSQKKVFEELFPNERYHKDKLYKLRAIYAIQN